MEQVEQANSTEHSNTPFEGGAETIQEATESNAVHTNLSEEANRPLEDKVMEKAAKNLEKAAKAEDKPAVEAKEESPVGEVADELPKEEAEAKYEANHKFTAFGKEHEVPDFLKGAIINPETEAQVKEILERSYAIDGFKEKLGKSREDYETVMQAHTQLDGNVNRILGFAERGDYDNFFNELGIGEEALQKWMLQKLSLNEDPMAKQMYEQQVNERAKLHQLEEQNQFLSQQSESHAVQARTMQLDSLLSRSDVASVAAQVDQKMGELGSFKRLVVEEGQKAWAMEQKDLSVEEAAQRVLSTYGKFIGEQQASPVVPAEATVQAPGQEPQVQAPAAKPVIPTVAAGQQTAVKPVVKNLDDLRAKYREISQG